MPQKSSESAPSPSMDGLEMARSLLNAVTQTTESLFPSASFSTSASSDSSGWLTSPTNPSLRYQSAGHRYFEGETEISSLSRLLECGGFTTDFSRIPTEVLARKTAIGQNVHKAIWLHLHDDLVWESLGEDLYGYVRAAARYIETRDSNVRWTELPFGSEALGYGCTPDVVWDDGYVEEWKCTYKIYPKVRIQLAGQSVAVNPDSPGGRRVVLLKPDGSYQAKEYDDQEDLKVFASTREVALWRMKHDR